MTPTRVVLAAGAVAGVIGLSLGAAGIASAASTATPTPTTAPAGSSKAPMNGNCPNMGGTGSHTSSSTNGSGV